MTQEDKELLLKDLCGRLPYGVKVTFAESSEREDCILNSQHLNSTYAIEYLGLKPFLRPISSMTEEEIIEFNNIPSTKNYTIIENDLPWDVAHYKQIDWLNKKMFDFRRLIPAGCAIEVTKDNNPYKD